MSKQSLRGFSVNRKVSEDNLSKRGVMAQRVVYDHIKAAGGSIKVMIDKNCCMQNFQCSMHRPI